MKELKGHINENSIIFLLLSKENEYNIIINDIKNNYDLDCEILMRKQFKNERLCVFKDTRRFDLALRKWITAVNGEVLKNSEDKRTSIILKNIPFDQTPLTLRQEYGCSYVPISASQ